MDTSNQMLTAHTSSPLDFLGRNSNIAGSVAAIAGGGLGFAVASAGALASGAGLVALGFAAVSYAAGFLLFSPSKQLISVDRVESEKVELETIQNNVTSLKASISEHAKGIPDDIILATDKIFDTLDEILPKWNKLASFSEEKYTVNAILTDYLPQIITSYVNLPKSYYRNAGKTQLAAEILEQLDTLYQELVKVRDNLYKGLEDDIKTQSLFLKSKFVTPDSGSLNL